MDISEEKFLGYFWWCYNRLKVIFCNRKKKIQLFDSVGLSFSVIWFLECLVVIFNVEGYMYSVLVGNTFGVAV